MEPTPTPAEKRDLDRGNGEEGTRNWLEESTTFPKHFCSIKQKRIVPYVW
jgi:hypothetical protein